MEQATLNPHKNKVHRVLAQSYLFFFFCFLAGIYFNIIFNFRIFKSSWVAPLGFVFLLLATILIVWAQRTSQNLKKGDISKENFSQGPYGYTRTPTHLGLFFLMLGLGMIINSFFIILFAFISFLFEKIIFLNKQEKILAEKYGAPYLEYKKSVKF